METVEVVDASSRPTSIEQIQHERGGLQRSQQQQLLQQQSRQTSKGRGQQHPRYDNSNPQQGPNATGRATTVTPTDMSSTTTTAEQQEQQPPLSETQQQTNPSAIGSSRPSLKVPPTRKDPRKLFVGGLPGDVTDEEFRTFFEQFGPVLDSVVMIDRDTHRSRGFGFVTFEDLETAHKMLSMGEESKTASASGAQPENRVGRLEMRGKMIEVKSAQPKESSYSGSFSPGSRRYHHQHNRQHQHTRRNHHQYNNLHSVNRPYLTALPHATMPSIPAPSPVNTFQSAMTGVSPDPNAMMMMMMYGTAGPGTPSDPNQFSMASSYPPQVAGMEGVYVHAPYVVGGTGGYNVPPSHAQMMYYAPPGSYPSRTEDQLRQVQTSVPSATNVEMERNANVIMTNPSPLPSPEAMYAGGTGGVPNFQPTTSQQHPPFSPDGVSEVAMTEYFHGGLYGVPSQEFVGNEVMGPTSYQHYYYSENNNNYGNSSFDAPDGAPQGSVMQPAAPGIPSREEDVYTAHGYARHDDQAPNES